MRLSRFLRPAFLTGFAGIGLAVLLGFNLLRQHDLAIEMARSQTQTFANVLEEHARQSFLRIGSHLQEADQALSGLRTSGSFDPVRLRTQLMEMLPADRLILSFMVLDRKGNVLLSTAEPNAVAASSHADRDYFVPHIRGADRALSFGAPERNPVDGAWMLPVSRRITLPGGAWGGVLVAMVQPGYFQSFYDSIDRGGSRFVSLYLTSGYVAVTSPQNETVMGSNWSNAALFREDLPNWPTGTVQQVAIGGSADSIYSYRVLNDYPVLISYGLSTASALATWRATAWRSGLFLLVAWMALAATGAMLTSLRQSPPRCRTDAG